MDKAILHNSVVCDKADDGTYQVKDHLFFQTHVRASGLSLSSRIFEEDCVGNGLNGKLFSLLLGQRVCVVCINLKIFFKSSRGSNWSERPNHQSPSIFDPISYLDAAS